MKNMYYYIGVNPTVDLMIVNHKNEILLVTRDDNYPVCAGMKALPGGFWDSPSSRGEAWTEGLETSAQAATREAREETGAVIHENDIHFIGVYEGNGRDPRDNDVSWSKSYAYICFLSEAQFSQINLVSQAGEVKALGWYDINSLENLAFDHAHIIQDGLAQYANLKNNSKKMKI